MSLARQNLCQLHRLNAPKVLACCNVRHYHDQHQKYQYWSYESPGIQKKGESYLTFFIRNIRYKWLELKDFVAPRVLRQEQSRVIWQFEGPESIERFRVTSDESIGGKSKAYLTSSRNNKLLFYGRLSTELPKDGVTERSGYCYLQMKERYVSCLILKWLSFIYSTYQKNATGFFNFVKI